MTARDLDDHLVTLYLKPLLLISLVHTFYFDVIILFILQKKIKFQTFIKLFEISFLTFYNFTPFFLMLSSCISEKKTPQNFVHLNNCTFDFCLKTYMSCF